MNILEGIVIGAKTKNTILVQVQRRTAHPMYKKLIKRRKSYKVDPAGIEIGLGDSVEIAETKPMSKDKYFKVLKVIVKKED